MAADRIVGSMSYVLRNVTSECFNSLDPAAMPHTSDDSLYTGTGASSSSGSSSGGGGTPSWVWAVVGTVAGLAALAAGAAAFFWRRRRQQQGQALGLKPEDCMESGSAKGSDDRKGLVVSRGGSLQPDQSGSVHGGAGSGGLNGQAHGSAELHTTFMRTRFGVIDDLQLGEVLGRGAYGRVGAAAWREAADGAARCALHVAALHVAAPHAGHPLLHASPACRPPACRRPCRCLPGVQGALEGRDCGGQGD